MANAPCSWGMVDAAGHADAPGWRQVLDEIQESGYAGTELGDPGFMPEDADLLRAELAERSLAMLGAFVPVRLSDAAAHGAGETAALSTARLLKACVAGTPQEGKPFVILADDAGDRPHRMEYAGRIRPEHGLSESGWRNLADGVQRIAYAVREQTGLRTVFHHHSGTFVETPQETATLLDLTAPDLVGLCLDTGHYSYGGGDPLDGLRRFRDRVWHVHLKDCDPEVVAAVRREGWGYLEALRRGIFCGLGEGTAQNGSVLEELQRSGYRGWIVVENEAPHGIITPLEYARRDRDYLRTLGL